MSDIQMASTQLDTPGKDSWPKRHAACDECRSRKLKCSGEPAGCQRCITQGIHCHYSIQKQMGRPRKRPRWEEESRSENQIELESDWLPVDVISDATALYPPLDISGNEDPLPEVELAPSSDCAALPQPVQLQGPVAPSTQTWADFSTTLGSTSLLSNIPREAPPGGDNPTCPCLSYLYLCLSNFATLNSFSINRETITSLYSAARTAQSVIRCEICPLRFATGIQNVMMLMTLLSVMADAWYQISLADPEVLGPQLASPEIIQLISENKTSSIKEYTWNQWMRRLLGRAMIGTPMSLELRPEPSTTSTSTRSTFEDTPDLYALIRELEDRQRYWHGTHTSQPFDFSETSRTYYTSTTPELSSSSSTTTELRLSRLSRGASVENPCIIPLRYHSEGAENAEENDYLCLKIVGAVKVVIKKFGFRPDEYPEGVPPLL